jgi:alpha-galactosidase
MGPDAFFVACGAPILPSLGLCDALRVGPDVSSSWENERDEVLLHNPSVPGARSAIRTTVNRLWLKPLVVPDPDVAFFRSIDCSLTPDEKSLLAGLALICGFRSTSDPPQWLSADEREQLRDFLVSMPDIQQIAPRRFLIDGRELDFNRAAEMSRHEGAWNVLASAALGWVADHEWALQLDRLLSRGAARERAARLRLDL